MCPTKSVFLYVFWSLIDIYKSVGLVTNWPYTFSLGHKSYFWLYNHHHNFKHKTTLFVTHAISRWKGFGQWPVTSARISTKPQKIIPHYTKQWLISWKFRIFCEIPQRGKFENVTKFSWFFCVFLYINLR